MTSLAGAKMSAKQRVSPKPRSSVMNEPTLIERLRHHQKHPVVGAISDEYFHELFGRSADRIEELESRIENANQSASETHRDWESRCHAIMAALGEDYGDY